MLAKNPTERPTLTEVQARLRQSVSSSSILALPPPSMPEPPTQSGPRPVSEIRPRARFRPIRRARFASAILPPTR